MNNYIIPILVLVTFVISSFVSIVLGYLLGIRKAEKEYIRYSEMGRYEDHK